MLNCFDYIIEQYAIEYGTREDDFGNKKTEERLSVLDEREQMSSINQDFYDTVAFIRIFRIFQAFAHVTRSC